MAFASFELSLAFTGFLSRVALGIPSAKDHKGPKGLSLPLPLKHRLPMTPGLLHVEAAAVVAAEEAEEVPLQPLIHGLRSAAAEGQEAPPILEPETLRLEEDLRTTSPSNKMSKLQPLRAATPIAERSMRSQMVASSSSSVLLTTSSPPTRTESPRQVTRIVLISAAPPMVVRLSPTSTRTAPVTLSAIEKRNLCSVECPITDGMIYTTDHGEVYKMSCGKRHVTTPIGGEIVSSLEQCMDTCSSVLQCHSVDYHSRTKKCYQSNHQSDPTIQASGFASEHSLGCANTFNGGCGCSSRACNRRLPLPQHIQVARRQIHAHDVFKPTFLQL
ncbi:hypothetical protein H112_04482 [Trichophyton rubrum D6]|uniref:Apple domain-containing protein n=4 Tax=Trichophyton TaxID=5550 RepID=F2SMU2_TRIRC|nr:uncharacterized protein TERG_04252 [Trichophyton rubrum CBS 118892]EZF23008.1 hypothetical protein H100_04491 [Trichophyton rubrum MR850]EZF41834.1 hypothetical protein H102_04475 [Trichophyton rubrum CBS 100081]EZF52418.1 hypothetical protein H103_04487 [Trichophyton rubrum CBS 288.86]EZF63109.1 hypothetical protein H104_04473 [Trichophyton rubrum CBS 289.86]EZF73693.1 hypothetical protein H105_04499 [Trichophyton soudanense CBS 452.61]EZF84335.1 hypothetical protein H110_04476 [Trichophy